MSFCKPRIEYYLQISQKINEPPDACLMVGNDPVNDMVAANAGMMTYLTDDSKDKWRMRVDASEVLERLKIENIPERTLKVHSQKYPTPFINFSPHRIS